MLATGCTQSQEKSIYFLDAYTDSNKKNTSQACDTTILKSTANQETNQKPKAFTRARLAIASSFRRSSTVNVC
jgi:hypothetical protein